MSGPRSRDIDSRFALAGCRNHCVDTGALYKTVCSFYRMTRIAIIWDILIHCMIPS